MAHTVITRRGFLGWCAALGAALGAGSLLAACSSGNGGGDAAAPTEGAGGEASSLDCTDTTGLSDTDIATRQGLAYIEQTEIPDQLCSNCQHYVDAPPGECGTCALIPGPINPDGWCMSWTEKLP
jgi:hypothetical protein